MGPEEWNTGSPVMHSPRRALFAGAVRATALPGVSRMCAMAARLRRRSLILLYHRILPDPRSAHHVVPSVAPGTLRMHVEAIQEIADVVPLPTLLAAHDGHRLRVALTFDDDDPSHVEHALPVLAELRVPATFFVSGRALAGLGDYWWVMLEHALAAEGVRAVAGRLGVSGGVAEMAKACEDPRVSERLSAIDVNPERRQLYDRDIRELASAGMTIGFHTLEHQVLPSLDGAALHAALTSGRSALEAITATAVELIAYPYGRADTRVARSAAAAGYRAGFITGGRAVAARTDPFLIPRWEPGPLEPVQLVAEALLRLHAPARGTGRSL